MNIYIAGASSELPLVESYMDRARSAGHRITRDWCALVRTHGHANPTDPAQRRILCMGDVDGILNCELFWLLVPKEHSIGCWVELGMAHNLGRSIFMSGDWGRTIFSALADRLYTSHDNALQAIVNGC